MENNITISLTLENEKIEKMKAFYEENIFPSKSEYISTLIKLDNVTITIYHTNKVVFQGKDADLASDFWVTTEKINSGNVQVKNSSNGSKNTKQKKELNNKLKSKQKSQQKALKKWKTLIFR